MLWLLSGCYTMTHYKEPKQVEDKYISKPEFHAPPANPSHEFFLIGDTGEPNLEGEDAVFAHLSKHVIASNEQGISNVVLLLGDNIYKHGYLKGSGKAADSSQYKLEVQLKYLASTNSKTYFIPGNHDYTYMNPLVGRSRVKAQFSEISKNREGQIFFAPDPNDMKKWADVMKIKTGADSVGMVIIDSQRFLNYFDSTGKRGDAMIDHVIREVNASPQIKTWLFATHHPLESVGKHGVTDSRVKLRQDLEQAKYRKYRRRMDAMIRSLKVDRPDINIVFTSGHDHSLQLFELDKYVQIVSGAGSKSTYIAAKQLPNSLQFAQANVGYAVLSIYDNEEVWVAFYGAYGARDRDYLLYAQKLF
jgi:hypothetical protein